MIIKTRPVSSSTRFRPPTPAHLTTNQNNQEKTITENTKTLNNLIPDMPALTARTKSTTALLYSKFIMKGIKTNKIDLVKESFNMKK